MKKTFLSKINFKILIPIIFLTFISLITLKNINILVNLDVANIDFFKKQAVGFILGAIGIIIIYNVNIKAAKTLIDIFYYTLVIMLFILIANIPIISSLFVNTSHGASGWFKIISPSLSFQPVEFFKIFIVLKLATISSDYLKSNYNDRKLFKDYFIYGAIPIFLVLLEPDLGGTLLLTFSAGIMFLFSIKDKKILKSMLFIISIFFILILLIVFFDSFKEFIIKFTPIQSYQIDRIDSWLDPFNTEKGYQLSQSLILMGSAGPFGYGTSFNSIAIPEAQTDLIFPAIVGFWGWIVGLLIILSYTTIILEIFKIINKQEDLEYKFICIGFVSLLFLQVIENIGMLVGILPITGIVLPFLSYGLSALLTYSAIIGIILNISKETNFKGKSYKI